jgi:hypothetical protein
MTELGPASNKGVGSVNRLERKRGPLRILRLATLASLCGGCSFVFVDAPPPQHEKAPPQRSVDCTTGPAAPVLDTILGTKAASVAVRALATEGSSEKVRAGSSLAAAVFITSAVYGYINTSACREAKEKRLIRLLRGPGPGDAREPQQRVQDEWRPMPDDGADERFRRKRRPEPVEEAQPTDETMEPAPNELPELPEEPLEGGGGLEDE